MKVFVFSLYVGFCTACKRVVSVSLAARAAGRRAVRCSISRGLCRSACPLIGRCVSRVRRPCRPGPQRRPAVVLDLLPRQLVCWRGFGEGVDLHSRLLKLKSLCSNIYTRLCSVCGRLALSRPLADSVLLYLFDGKIQEVDLNCSVSNIYLATNHPTLLM